MKVFGKKGKSSDKPAETINPDSNQNVVVSQPVDQSKGSKVSEPSEKALQSSSSQPVSAKKSKLAPIIAIVLILIGVGLASAYYLQARKEKIANETTANESKMPTEDKEKALEHDKKLLAKDPNNINLLIDAATYAKEINPEESKSYFAKAFELYKQEHNLEDISKTPTISTYFGAAGLAEQAGYSDEAIKYYGLVIKTANTSDNYQKNVAEQSKAAIERLK